MYDLLENWLRHKSDMVNIEAARAICDMRNVTATELYRPVAGMLPSDTLALYHRRDSPCFSLYALRRAQCSSCS